MSKKKTKLEKLKSKANKLYKEFFREIKEIEKLSSSINKKSFEYVETLKEIEEEILK